MRQLADLAGTPRGQATGLPAEMVPPRRRARSRTEIWEGWVYVTLDPEVPSIADRLAPLRDLVGRYRAADYVPVAAQDFVWKTNWKLLTENSGIAWDEVRRKLAGGV